MSRSAPATTFKLRTPAHIQSCHLVGSWDNYGKQYNMTADTAAGPGWWRLSLRISGASQRFWYYYILDGYFESHDPNKPTCKEPTRGITLNILECGASSPVPSSGSSSSSHSSRFPSPSSSAGTSPISTTSDKRYRSRPTISDPILQGSSALPHTSAGSHHSRRRESPPPVRPASHIIHPKPRNPLTQHKLTLDTNCRPISMITTAATTAGDSPISASSSRSASSLGSICSSCSSGSTVFSEDSPTTPICRCGSFESGFDSEGESCCSEDSYEDEYQDSHRVRVSHHSSHHRSSKSNNIAYELERRLRI